MILSYASWQESEKDVLRKNLQKNYTGDVNSDFLHYSGDFRTLALLISESVAHKQKEDDVIDDSIQNDNMTLLIE